MNRPLLALLLEDLNHRVTEATHDEVLTGLAMWVRVLPRAGSPRPATESSEGRTPRYQDVVRAAIAVATGIRREADLTSGMNWLLKRHFFRPDRGAWGLEVDPVSVLMLAAGVRRLQDNDQYRSWVAEFTAKALGVEVDQWRKSLLLAAGALVGESTWDDLLPELRVALEAIGLCATTTLDRDQACASVLNLNDPIGDDRAIVRLAALRRLMLLEGALDVRHTTVDDLVTVLRRAPDALKRWPWGSSRPRKPNVTWDISSEYDVQALLYALLRPVFDDLVDEEHLKSIGYKHPRADLAIPRLRVIIEVKFLYRSTQSALAEAVGQVSEDTGLYLSEDNGYDTIIAVLWDNTSAVHHHATLADGIRKLRGIHDAVVIPRPGTWTRAEGGDHE